MKKELTLGLLGIALFFGALQVNAEPKYYMYTNEKGEQVLIPASDIQVMGATTTPAPAVQEVTVAAPAVVTAETPKAEETAQATAEEEEKNAVEVMAEGVNNLSNTINTVGNTVSNFSSAVGNFNKALSNFGK